MPIKYSYELLNTFCIEKNVELLNDYSNETLYGSSKINFKCTKCLKPNIKCFTYLIKRNTLCKRCVTIESLTKQKETMMKKYGVEHASQNINIKNKIKETFLTKYGVDNPSKSIEIQNKQKQTNIKKYGVEYIIHNPESKEKMIQTNLQKYGAECCLMNSNIQNKIKNTNILKYGVENVSQNKEINDKMKNTMFEKYGVNYPLQNSEIAEKASKICFKSKKYIFPSGKEIKCQGYEPFAIDDLIKLNINECDIITGKNNVPEIWYYDINGIKRRHYVDIFIPSQNKCIEVKSNWTLEKINSNIYDKQNAAKELNYIYEIWVYDSKGNKINSII